MARCSVGAATVVGREPHERSTPGGCGRSREAHPRRAWDGALQRWRRHGRWPRATRTFDPRAVGAFEGSSSEARQGWRAAALAVPRSLAASHMNVRARVVATFEGSSSEARRSWRAAAFTAPRSLAASHTNARPPGRWRRSREDHPWRASDSHHGRWPRATRTFDPGGCGRSREAHPRRAGDGALRRWRRHGRWPRAT